MACVVQELLTIWIFIIYFKRLHTIISTCANVYATAHTSDEGRQTKHTHFP